MKTIVYAASDATFIEIDSAKFRNPPTTFVQSGKVYRRLTTEYWAWFNHKYNIMEQALLKKKISEATFEVILERIAALYIQAMELYGADVLKEAEKTTDIKEWEKMLHGPIRQPVPQTKALSESHKSENPISPESAATQTALIF